MLKKSVAALALSCFGWFGSACLAETLTLLEETEFGRKTTSEETEAQVDEINVSKHSLEVDYSSRGKFHSEAKATYWEKDYNSLNDLDNVTRIYSISPSVYFLRNESQSFQISMNAKQREKRYTEAASNNFNQFSVEPTFLWKKDKETSLSVGIGWNDTRYLNDSAKDQTLYFQETKVKKTFLEDFIDLKSSYRVDLNRYDRAGKEKIKHEVFSSGKFNLSRSWIESVEVAGSFGKRDTKETEERDEDLDFSFWDYKLKSSHSITPFIHGTLQYSAFEKDFRADAFDSNGWEAGTNLDFLLMETSKKDSYFGLKGKFKTVEYPSQVSSSYKKFTANINSSYQIKKNWKASLGYESNLYGFNLSSQDKNRHSILMDFGEWFKGGKFYSSQSLAYHFTDRADGGKESSLSASFSLKSRF